MEVLGLDHVDLTVTHLDQAIDFYQTVLGALGFSRVEHSTYVAWSNGKLNIAVREAADEHRKTRFDRTRSGLHHLALKAKTRGDVDTLHSLLIEKGLTVLDAPAEYPEYGPDYYAVFFADPDGTKLELVHFPWGYWRRVQRDGHDDRARSDRPANPEDRLR